MDNSKYLSYGMKNLPITEFTVELSYNNLGENLDHIKFLGEGMK